MARRKLLTKKELAAEIKCSTRTIDRMVKEGLPTIRIGSHPRFEINKVLAHLSNSSRIKSIPI